jgi:hypothetical protein
MVGLKNNNLRFRTRGAEVKTLMETQQYTRDPQTPSDRWRKGAPTEKLWELYQRLGSTHRVGEAVGMSFSAVHRRLTKAGHKLLGPAGESRDCAHCGKPFQATNCKDIYCSGDCAHDANNERQNRYHRARHPLSEKQCKNPGCPLPDRKFMAVGDKKKAKDAAIFMLVAFVAVWTFIILMAIFRVWTSARSILAAVGRESQSVKEPSDWYRIAAI